MKTDAVEKQEYKGYVISIVHDEDPMNPRTDYGNMGIMACFHKRYTLGDNTHGLRHEDFGSWDEMESQIWAEFDAAIVLPIYMYEHSGITIRTCPFECGWDSGQIGFIYVTKAQVRKEYGCKRISKRILNLAKQVLLDEVKTYDGYLTGEVYGWKIKKKTEDDDDDFLDDDLLDSSYGYFGYESIKDMIEEAKRNIDAREKTVDIPQETATVAP